MNACYDTRYKDCDPLDTIEHIRKILSGLGIMTIEKWQHEVPEYYSLHMEIQGVNSIFSNGKGTTAAFALASAYAELLERLQNLWFAKANGGMSKEAFECQGFFFAPDEKLLNKKMPQENSEKLKTVFTRSNGMREMEKSLLEIWEARDLYGDWDPCPALPYFNITDSEIYYIPMPVLTDIYCTNGMCAGNTKHEALVQGLSEVIERYVQRKIFLERIVPPTIPESYIMVHYPNLYNMIKELESKGSFRIIVKDCSLGKGFPAVAIIFLDRESHSFFIRFGCHPAFDIALERCLTELLQGKTIYKLDWMMRLSFFDEEIYSKRNLRKVYVDGPGWYPVELFGDRFSYEFKGIKDMQGRDNEKMLSYLIDILHDNECNILVRDVSFLGFPSFHIIVPFFSEMVEPGMEYYPWSSELQKCGKILMRLESSGDDELLQIIDYFYKHLSPYSPITSMIHKPLGSAFPWTRIKRDLFISLAYYRMGDYKNAYTAMERFTSVMQSEYDDMNKAYYSCVKDYLGAHARGMRDLKKIEGMLAAFYPEKIVEKVISGLKNPKNVFKNCSKLNCFNCSECAYIKQCYYPQHEKLFMKLKKIYAQNAIEQNRIAELFSCRK